MKLVFLGLLPKLSVVGNVSSFYIRFAAQGELGASPRQMVMQGLESASLFKKL